MGLRYKPKLQSSNTWGSDVVGSSPTPRTNIRHKQQFYTYADGEYNCALIIKERLTATL